MATGTITKVTNNSASGYCKMPDGTLICWGRQEATIEPNSRTIISVTYQVPFISKPSISAFLDAATIDPTGTAVINCAMFTGNGSGTIYVGNKMTSQTTNDVCYIAIGRWK